MASATQTALTPAVTGYSTEERLFSMRYKQGGRTVFSLALTPDQLVNLIARPDPNAMNPGNRKIRPSHAAAFATYFEEHDDWVIPGIILRAPSIFSFEMTNEVDNAQFGVLAYPKRSSSDIQILDGQHRILGFHIAFKEIADNIDKARSTKNAAERTEGKGSTAAREAQKRINELEKQRDRLYAERVMVEVQVTDDPTQYRQMFYDIAENALGITAAVKARFDSRKVVNRALPTVLEHPLLDGRVDMDIDRIGASNPNLMSARHVIEIIRSLTVGLEGRVGKRAEKELNDLDIARKGTAFLNLLTEVFPPLKAVELGQIIPTGLRSSSLLGSPLLLRILAGVHYSLITEHGFSPQMVRDYFAALAPHMVAPVHENSIWWEHAPSETFSLGAYGPNGRRQDSAALNRALIEWAIDKAPFVYADPKPAPAPVVDEDEGIDFAPDHDTKALEVDARNEAEGISETAKKRGK